MLAASWLACGWLIDRFQVPGRWPERLAMGAIAFGLLMLAELGVSLLAFGRSVAEHPAIYRQGSAQLGLLAQIAFALLPLARKRG